MRGVGNRPEGRAQDRVGGREPGVHGAAGCRRAHPALPSLQDALTAALRQRVAQRAARNHGVHPPLVGYLCECCQDAPALLVQPAPWGGEMGVCAPCAGLPPDVPAAHQDVVPACLICAQPPGPDEDAAAYVQHCFDTGHPLRPGAWQLRPGTRIYL